jgi:uncharacterized protein YbjT (DUF2867 family)
MKIVVVPASTKTGAAAIRALLSQASTNGSRHEVVGMYRNLEKVPVEFGHNEMFTATQGDIADASSLDLSGADGVITITPPVFEDTDIVKRAEAVSGNVKTAIERAGTIKNLVLLSSVLAHLDKGVVSPGGFGRPRDPSRLTKASRAKSRPTMQLSESCRLRPLKMWFLSAAHTLWKTGRPSTAV